MADAILQNACTPCTARASDLHTLEITMNDPTTTTQSLIDAAESAVQAFNWTEVLFEQIKKEAEAMAGPALHVRALAEMGGHIAQCFGNDLDVAREDLAKEAQS